MTTPEHADKPWPRAAASAAVFRGDQILLVQRASNIAIGRWSLPGGHIEPGETAAAAAAREVLEETGIEVRLQGFLGVHDIISRTEDGALRAHYLLAVYYGAALSGEAVGQSDAAVARFVQLSDLGGYQLTDSAAHFIEDGWRRFTAGSDASI